MRESLRLELRGVTWARELAISFAPLALLVAGCGQILGLDEYGVGTPPTPSCLDGEVRTGGNCKTVGVPPTACAPGKFVPDRDGCEPILPADVCAGDLLLARPGNRECLSPRACTSGGFAPASRPAGKVFHVRAGASPGGTGTIDAPFRGISDAVVATVGEAEPTILIWDGEYRERVVVTHKVFLVGNCPADAGTRVVGDGTDGPTVTFTPEASGAKVSGTQIRGGNPGILVDGAADIQILDSVVIATEGPGIRIDDRKGPAASALVGGAVVEGALGAGIVAYGGSRIEVSGGTVRGTRDPGPGIDSCGICVRASSVVPWPLFATPGPERFMSWDPRQSLRPTLLVTGTLVEDNAGEGISIIGASAEVKQSVVRSTERVGAPEQRIGIDVSERSFGAVPASLVLEQSVIRGMTSVGVRSHDATVTVSRSVIADIGGGSDRGTKRCLGNGIRARWDRDPDPEIGSSPTLTVEDSLVDRTHEAGIFVEGGQASVQRSVVRDVAEDPCAGDLGDGIVVHALSGIPDLAAASLTVEESRVDGSARAALLASGGALVHVKSSALVGPRGVVTEPGSPAPVLDGVFCGGSGAGNWAECAPAREELERALLGGAGCDPSDETFCSTVCGRNSEDAAAPVAAPGVRWWSLDHDEVAPVVTDENGCSELEGLPRNRELRIASAARVPPASVPFDTDSWRFAYAAGQSLNTTGSTDGLTPPFALPTNEGYITFPFLTDVLRGTAMNPGPVPDFDFDLSTAPNLGVWACAARPGEAPSGTDICREPGRRVPGIVVSLDPPLHPSLGPYYADGATPKLGRPHTMDSPLGALALFLNVPAGERRVVFTAADIPENQGKTLDCTIDNGRGAGGGWTKERLPNTFRQVLTPAFATGLWAYCSLE